MIKNFIFSLCLSIVVSVVYGQEKIPFFSNWNLTASYFGNNLWNPGLQVGGEKVVSNNTKTKVSENESLTKHLQYYINGNFGFYIDNPTHWALFNNYQINFRRVQEKGKFISIGTGPGIMRTFLPETYRVTDNGDIERVKLPGRLYSAPVISLGVGRLWKRNNNNAWQFKIHNFWLLNYNNAVLPQIHVEYGYIFGYKSKEIE